jgi:membrane protease YdiL (CAAX protease family)
MVSENETDEDTENSVNATELSAMFVPLRTVVVCLCIHIVFCLIYLNVELFSNPTWMQNFVNEMIPGIMDSLIICVVAISFGKSQYIKMIGLAKPQYEHMHDLVYLIAIALLIFPIIILLPHFCPSLIDPYSLRTVFPDECGSFVRDCIKTGHTEYIGYFFIPKFIGAVILAPISEEIFYRGMLFNTLQQRWSPIKAGILSVAIFVAAHIGMVIANGMTSQFLSLLAMPLLIGVATCNIYYKTKCLLLAVAFHFLMNATVFAFGLGKVFLN